MFFQFLQFAVLYSSTTIFMYLSQSQFFFLPFCPPSSILFKIIELLLGCEIKIQHKDFYLF